MKRIIEYYYNLKPQKISHDKKKYKFEDNRKKYILYEYNQRKEDLEEKYKLQIHLEKMNFYLNIIIPNKNKNIITKYNNKEYVLIELRIKTRKINIMDILFITSVRINNDIISTIDRTNWKDMWKKKVDNVEKEININNRKIKCIIESIQYYIGIVENCISILEIQSPKTKYKTICHERVYCKMTTDDFYNPIFFIIDYRIREYGEYIRGIIYREPEKIYEVKKILYETLDKSRLDSDEIIMLFIRILYPGEYFDAYEKSQNGKEKELLKIINNSQNVENIIRLIYIFLSNRQIIPNIEWIKKDNTIIY